MGLLNLTLDTLFDRFLFAGTCFVSFAFEHLKLLTVCFILFFNFRRTAIEPGRMLQTILCESAYIDDAAEMRDFI